ncbi:MAG: radical SAM protein [Bacilli bacterium]
MADTAIGIYDKRISCPSAPALYSRKKPTPQELKKLSESAYIDISDDLSSHLHINKHFINYKDGGMSAKVSAFVSIMQGCQMNCSYCIVPKVRGLQRSRPADDIVSEVKILADQGVKEVTLLGQVVNAFGREVSAQGWNFGVCKAPSKNKRYRRHRKNTLHLSASVVFWRRFNFRIFQP